MTVKEMTRDDFQKIVHQIAGGPRKEGRGKTAVFVDTDVLEQEWSGGGVGGGSCWNNDGADNHYAIEGEPEPKFTDLTGVLTAVCPNITFLQYQSLEELIKYDTRNEREYYGNSSVTMIKSIKVQDIWDFLEANDLIKEAGYG